MMAELYSYRIDDLEDIGIIYTFYSPVNRRIYKVSFDTYVYQEYLSEYPMLLAKGYSLSFYNTPTDIGFRRKDDEVVVNTIVAIIQSFLEKKGEECVLLYHCDTSDGRQQSRHFVFGDWYSKYNLKASLTKEGLEVELPSKDGTKMYYIGYLTPTTNPSLQNIHQEFSDFSISMISFEAFKNRPPESSQTY